MGLFKKSRMPKRVGIRLFFALAHFESPVYLASQQVSQKEIVLQERPYETKGLLPVLQFPHL